MQPFPIEELVDRVGSRFTVVVAAAKRAKQIKEGAPPLVSLPTRNPLTIALREIAAGLVQIGEEVIVPEERPAAADEGFGDLAAPEVVESMLGKAAAEEEDISEGPDDDYDADLDEDMSAALEEDLDEGLEEEEEEEEEELEELDEDDEEEDWEEEELEEE